MKMGRKRGNGGGERACWRRTSTSSQQKRRKRWKFGQTVGLTVFSWKASGVVNNLELGFGVSFSSRLSKCIGCIKREVQGCC